MHRMATSNPRHESALPAAGLYAALIRRVSELIGIA
jgi:hypothetical protein